MNVRFPFIREHIFGFGSCLLQNYNKLAGLQSCQKELAQCILNPKCLANVICLNTCNGRKDEAECQIKCGDLFENDVVGVFNACAVRYGGKNNLIYNYLQKSSVNLLLKSKEMCPTKAR